MIPIKEKKFKNREILLEAALEEFCLYSFELASLNRIIKGSGTSKGSFYYHFENKEDLYIQLLLMSASAKWTFINESVSDMDADFANMDLFDKFLYQARAGAMFGHKHPKYSKLGMMFNKEKGNDIYGIAIEKLNADTDKILKDMIQEAYDGGEFEDEFTDEFVVSLITFMFESFNDIFASEKELEKNLDNLKSYVSFMKRGLKK